MKEERIGGGLGIGEERLCEGPETGGERLKDTTDDSNEVVGSDDGVR